ncbi:MAG: hypothetical protein Q9205_007229, partial [Flavoplaca limonia]
MAKAYDEKEMMSVAEVMGADANPVAGTAEDQDDMTHIGKKQELLRTEALDAGWLATLAWQTGIASGSYLTASQIQALMLLNDPSYVFERWHGTLLIIA